MHFVIRGVAVLHAAHAAQRGGHPGRVVDGVRPDRAAHQKVLPAVLARLPDCGADAGSVPRLVVLRRRNAEREGR